MRAEIATAMRWRCLEGNKSENGRGEVSVVRYMPERKHRCCAWKPGTATIRMEQERKHEEEIPPYRIALQVILWACSAMYCGIASLIAGVRLLE